MPSTTTPNLSWKPILFLIGLGVSGWLIYEKGFDHGPDRGPKRTVSPAARVLGPALFQIHLSPKARGWAVTGTARLPEGEPVKLEIAFSHPEAEAYDRTTAVVTGGGIEAGFGPYDAPLPSGIYTLRVRAADERTFAVARGRLGDEDSKIREEAERRAHFQRVLETIRESISQLHGAAAAAQEGKRFADSRGRFLPDLWRLWLDEVFEVGPGQVQEWQQAYRLGSAADRYPAASRTVSEVVDRVRTLGRSISAEVHREHGLSPPPGEASGVDETDLDSLLKSLEAGLQLEGLPRPPGDRMETVEADGVTFSRRSRGQTWSLAVDGSVELPDGCEYTVDLRYDRPENSIVASRRGTGREYWLRWNGQGRSLPSGRYILQIRLDYFAQSPETRQQIDEEFPELRGGLERTILVDLGTEADVAAEEEARLSHYMEILRAITGWFWELQDRLDDTSRGEAFIGQDGVLDLAALRAWSDGLDGELVAIRRRHDAYREATLALKYESEGRSVSQLIDAIGREKEKGLAALQGRGTPGGAFEITLSRGHLNVLVRNDICAGLGLPPVTLGSLRLGEGRTARGEGDREKALEIFLRLGSDRIEEKVVEAHALQRAAAIYLEEGKEWRALPLLETLAGRKRYRRQGAGRKAEEELSRLRGDGEPWPRDKQVAYRDDLAETLEGIRERIDDGRLEAAGRRLEGWRSLEKGYRDLFRKKIGDEEVLLEVDGLLSTAREAAQLQKTSETYLLQARKLVVSLRADLEQGRVDRFRERFESDLTPLLGQMEEVGIPGAIIRRVSRGAAPGEVEAGRIETARKTLADLGVELVGLSEAGEPLFRLPGEEKGTPRLPGDLITEGIYLLETRPGDGGTVVLLRLEDGSPLPLFLPQ